MHRLSPFGGKRAEQYIDWHDMLLPNVKAGFFFQATKTIFLSQNIKL